MKTLVNIIAMALVVAIIGFLVYATFWSSGHLGEVYGVLDLETRTILLTAVGAVLLGALLIVGGLRSAARLSARGALVERRLDLYRDLVASYGVVLGARSSESDRTESAEGLIEALSFELTLLAGTDVIEANGKLAAYLEGPASDSEALEEALGGLLKAMRRELGHPGVLDESKISWLSLMQASGRSGLSAAKLQGYG